MLGMESARAGYALQRARHGFPGLNDAHHIAVMTALRGPPPPEFLGRSEETSKYWSEDGELIHSRSKKTN